MSAAFFDMAGLVFQLSLALLLVILSLVSLRVLSRPSIGIQRRASSTSQRLKEAGHLWPSRSSSVDSLSQGCSEVLRGHSAALGHDPEALTAQAVGRL
jgi:hypothetical protein